MLHAFTEFINESKKDTDRIDAILDKIAISGMKSLTPAEDHFLKFMGGEVSTRDYVGPPKEDSLRSNYYTPERGDKDEDEEAERLLDKLEALEAFEEANGYPMGDEFIFSFVDDSEGTDLDYPYCITITPRSYWIKDKCQYDQHLDYILNLPDHLEEIAEGAFVSLKSDKECLKILVDLGFKFDPKYQDFIEDMNVKEGYGEKYTMDGMLLGEYMEKKYPQAIV
jgi:hypothetical protein